MVKSRISESPATSPSTSFVASQRHPASTPGPTPTSPPAEGRAGERPIRRWHPLCRRSFGLCGAAIARSLTGFGKERPVEAEITRLESADVALHHLMKPWQRMERDCRKAVMLGMERHVPGQKP